VTIKGFKLLEIAGVELIDADAKSYEDARRATQGAKGKR